MSDKLSKSEIEAELKLINSITRIDAIHAEYVESYNKRKPIIDSTIFKYIDILTFKNFITLELEKALNNMH